MSAGVERGLNLPDRSLTIGIDRMKHPYFLLPVLAMMFTANTANAQTAKPRPEKQSRVQYTFRPVGGTTSAAPLRGGANDECATAIPVTVTSECSGSLATYDATSATQSLDPILCNGYTSPEARDLWFSFVATSPITNVQVEGTLTFDPVLEGFAGSCGDLQSLGCADATFPPAEPENTTETLTMATQVGSTYYVRVYSYWSPEPTDLTFTLCIYSVTNAATNDLCTGVSPVAIAAGGSTTFTGDNTNAYDTEGLGDASVWHSFSISECLNVSVDYCGTTPAFGNGFTALYIGCPITDQVAPTSFNGDDCTDGNFTIYYNSLPAGTYYYAVMLDAENGAIGPYIVNVTANAITTYCDAALEECDETIGRVVVGSIDNTSDCEAGSVVDYTDQSTNMIQTEIVPITVENGGSNYAGNTVSVWVDWNQDNAFCDANELHVLASTDEGVTFTGNISCPPDALPGSTRMRVRMAFNADPQACGTVTYGEIEDYTVNVLLGNSVRENAMVDWSVFPNPSNGDMTITYAGQDAEVAIELFDVAGRMVHQELRQLANGQRTDLGLAGTLAHGSYTLRLATATGRSEQRVVVQ